MGVLYCVLPIDAPCAKWLEEHGVRQPPLAETSRLPTPSEILDVLRALPGYTFEVDADLREGEWTAQIDSAENPTKAPLAQLRVQGYKSDDEPHSFYFSKGWPQVVALVTERLTQRCGPLVVVADSCGIPVLVMPGSDVQSVVRRLEGELKGN